jgi:hypothetical protein
MENGLSRDEHFWQSLYRRAMQGNMRAAELWANYRYGKPVQYNVTAEWSVEGLRESLAAGIKRVEAGQAITVPLLEAENAEAAKAEAAASAKAKTADPVPEVNALDEAPIRPVVIQRQRPPQNIFDALNRPTRDPMLIGESFGSWRS